MSRANASHQSHVSCVSTKQVFTADLELYAKEELPDSAAILRSIHDGYDELAMPRALTVICLALCKRGRRLPCLETA